MIFDPLSQDACQGANECEPVPEVDEAAAEYDAMLIEAAEDVLPAAAKVIGRETFAPYFA